MQEAQRHIALTTVACAPQWGIAILLTRDTEGHTHVSTPPHTTPTRHAEEGEGDRGVQGGGGGRSMAEGGGGRVNGLWGVGGSENTKIDFSGDTRIERRESTSWAQQDDGCSCGQGKHNPKQHEP